MKSIGKRAVLIALVTVLLSAALACAETVEGQEPFLPGLITNNMEHYRKEELTNLDRLEYQIAAYVADTDELPDVDIYQFTDSHTFEEYARLESGIYGAPYYVMDMTSGKAASYVSAELFDDQWYLVRNTITERDDMLYEVCTYFKTRQITLPGSSRTVFLPASFTEAKAEQADEGIVYLGLNEFSDNVNDPYRIETFNYDNLRSRQLVEKLITEHGLQAEEVTLCGYNYFVLYGSVGEESGYTKTYIFNGDKGAVGINFLYRTEPNGFDLAVMNTAR